MASEDSRIETSNVDSRETEELAEPLPDKETLEREKLRLEIEKLREEKNRGGKPTAWEVVKTAVPWVSIFLSVVVFTCEYRDRVKQQQADRLATATANYLGKHQSLGVTQLLQYAATGDADAESEVTKVLASGLRAEITTADARNRNRVAVEALSRLPSDSGKANAIKSLCPFVAQWTSQLDLLLQRYPTSADDDAAKQDEINDGARVLCSSREVSPDACNAKLSPQSATTFDSFIPSDLADCGPVKR